MASYYYLLTGLPNLGAETLEFSVDELASYLSEELTESDNQLLQLITTDIKQRDADFYARCQSQKQGFIKDWFEFQQQFRNTLATLSKRILQDAGIKIDDVLIGDNEFSQALNSSSAREFGLGGIYPWVEDVVEASSLEGIEREKRLDEIQLEVLDELTPHGTFAIEEVLAYFEAYKLNARWHSCTREIGSAALVQRVNEIEAAMDLTF